jgi:hypothetical protein
MTAKAADDADHQGEAKAAAGVCHGPGIREADVGQGGMLGDDGEHDDGAQIVQGMESMTGRRGGDGGWLRGVQGGGRGGEAWTRKANCNLRAGRCRDRGKDVRRSPAKGGWTRASANSQYHERPAKRGSGQKSACF